ncbi:MAG: glycosyltransferase family 4 protein [Pseudomonadota bacterium]
MKIALVVPGGVDRSGEYRVIPVVLALLERLAQHHAVHVFALAQEPRPARWQLCGADIQNIGSARAVPRAAATILRENRVARFDIVHALWAGAGGLVAAIAARLAGAPLLVHLTGGELVALPEIGYGASLQWHWRRSNRWVLRRCARLTATSAPIVAMAATAGFTATRVPLGIDLRAWPPRPPMARDPRSVMRLIQVASLNRVKDHATTLEALRLLLLRGHRVEIDFVGDDTLQGAVQARAHELGVAAATRFHGFLTQRQLRPLMESAHLHVVSSLHEAGPAAALEAAVAGIPTVGTRVGHLTEWEPDAAYVVPVRDAAAMAGAIEGLLIDEAARLRLAQRAQVRGVAEDADYTAARFQTLYAEVRRD